MDRAATIAIIDSNLENRADLQKMLEGSAYRVVADAGFGVEAATTIAEARPSCILLSLEEPIIRGLQTMEVIAQVAPATPVLVYSSLDERSVVRQAMQAGSRDYLVTPLTTEVLVPAIRHALEQEVAQQRRLNGEQAADAVHGMVLTVFGTKGGIGKTTIAVNLALAIQRETSASVALVDMDVRFGCVAVLMDVTTDKSLVQACRDVESLTHVNVRDHLCQSADGLWVLPASQDLADWEAIDLARVRKLIAILSQSFDYVILDTPGAFSDTVAVAVEQAMVVLLVTSLEVTSARNTLLALQLLKGWSYPEERIKLVANHPNSAPGLGQRAVAEALDREIFWEVPFDLAVSQSLQAGKPLVLQNPRSEAAKSITALARKVGGISPSVRDHRFDKPRAVADFLRRTVGLQHTSKGERRGATVHEQRSTAE